MLIETRFTVPVPPEQAWPLLLDVPRIAPCLPGAELTEVAGDRRYKGRATVKVGPVQLTFAGQAEITNVDDVARTARVTAKGADAKGRGNASATVDFALAPEGTGTRVDVRTDLQLVGAVAQYGRAAGLLKEIANQLVQQFADNLRSQLGAAAPARGATPARDAIPARDATPTRSATPAGSAAPAGSAPTGAASVEPAAAATDGSSASPATAPDLPQATREPHAPSGPPVTPRPGPSQPAPAARPISAFALLWAALKAMAGRWLGRGSDQSGR